MINERGTTFLKKILSFVLIIFFVILLAVPIYWLTKGETSDERSVVESRDLAALRPAATPNLQRGISLIKEGKVIDGVKILIDLYTSSSFIEKFETATSDQFPFRLPVIQFSKSLERGIIKFTYSFTDDIVIPADMTNDIYYDAVNDQLLQPINLFNADSQELIDERIENYVDLIQTYPEQKFYLYYHQIIDDSEFHPMAQYFPQADKGQSIEYFENNLPEGLRLKKFLLTSMEDHLKYYYRTDLHWNVHGIFRAYEEIYELLSKDYPEISPILAYEKIITFPDIKFLGLMARLTFYPIDGDDFSVEVIDIPPHEMRWGGQIVSENTKNIYFAGEYSRVPYVNHYNEFYGYPTGLIEYTFDNDSDRNLLIFGSSYINALEPLLASHYQKTYCVDLRRDTDFSLSDFLEKYDVDDIVIVGDYKVAFQQNDYWLIKH